MKSFSAGKSAKINIHKSISVIEDARNFILDRVDNPALINPKLPKNVKDKVQATKNLMNKFKRVGDLDLYMKRFNQIPAPNESIVYDGLKAVGLKTYEDIFPEFEQKFTYELSDITTLNDFIIGNKYTSWDIAIFSKTYNCQSGIYLIGTGPKYQAIFVKATLSGGKYENKWLIQNEEFKYYMYALKDKFDPAYKVNKAIINSKDIPIYVFMKDSSNDSNGFTLSGIFNYMDYTSESDGSKWFRLRKTSSLRQSIISNEEYNQELEKQIKKSRNMSQTKRDGLLASAHKKPEQIQTITTTYKRNPDVIVSVLERAKGICERCHKPAPFYRASDSTPYLEVHHVVPLSKDGDDTVDNAIALCPNCHREVHFGKK